MKSEYWLQSSKSHVFLLFLSTEVISILSVIKMHFWMIAIYTSSWSLLMVVTL